MHSPHSCALFSINWEAKADSKQLLVQCSFSETFEAADKRRELKLTNASSLQQLSLIPSPNTHPKYSRIPPLESDIDNWSQISVGRSQKDLLFTPTQLSISHSPVCIPLLVASPPTISPPSKSLSTAYFENTTPFTATVNPPRRRLLMTLTQNPFLASLYPQGSVTSPRPLKLLWVLYD